MTYRHIINEIKCNNLNISDTLLDKHNPYIGTFPWYWKFMFIEPKYKTVETQTEPDLYHQLGKKIAKKYGKGWESVLLEDS